MKNTHRWWTAIAVVSGILVCTATHASVEFLGVPGSYAASDGQLARGQTLKSWTIEVWIKPQVNNVWQGIFQNDSGIAWEGNQFDLSPQGKFDFLDTWGAYYVVSSPTGSITPNQWQLLSIVGDGNKLSAYQNGVLVGIGPYPGQASFAAVHESIFLGAFDFGVLDYATLPDAGWFLGSMADFRVWDRALTSSDILSHVSLEPAINDPGLVDWIPFNETSGNTFYDIVSGQNGTYHNVVLSNDAPFASIPEPQSYVVFALIAMALTMLRKQATPQV